MWGDFAAVMGKCLVETRPNLITGRILLSLCNKYTINVYDFVAAFMLPFTSHSFVSK